MRIGFPVATCCQRSDGKKTSFCIRVMFLVFAVTTASPKGWAQELQLPPLPSISSTAAITNINICSLDSTRSNSPFATATGNSGYARLRSSLQNTANFGPAGIVPAPVTIRPGVATLNATTLAGCHVLFLSHLKGPLSDAEDEALGNANDQGMVVIADADDDATSQAAVNALISDAGWSVGPGTACPSTPSATSGQISTQASNLLTGAFGNIGGGSFATSLSAVVTGPGGVNLASCTSPSGVVRVEAARGLFGPLSGRVMIGGDSSGTDLFTNPSSASYNPNNERMYLNAIADVIALERPTCPVTLNKTTFVNGETVTIQSLRLSNQNTSALPVMLHLFLDIPTYGILGLTRTGFDGSLVLPSGMNQTIGPIPLFTVSSSLPRGTWRIGCVLSNPVSNFFLQPWRSYYSGRLFAPSFTLQ